TLVTMTMKLVYVLIFIPLISAELETLNVADNRFASANLNGLIDRSIHQISQFIVDYGLDPLDLPPTTKKLWVNFPQTSKHAEPIPFKADLSLHSGILKHLSNLKRYGDATMNYKNKLLKLNIGFEFKQLEVLYDFAIKVFFFHYDGRILALTKNVRAKFCVSFNVSDTSLFLDEFDLQLPSPGQNVEIRANLDKVVDTLLPVVRQLILNNEMDPMQLPNVSTHIFPHLTGKLKGNLDLKNGWIQNLSLVKRTQHVTAKYKDLLLTMDMNLGFEVISFNYDYNLKHLLYKRKGNVYGRLHNLDVNVVVVIDLNKYYLLLDSIKFSNVWKFDLQFGGNLLDPVVNALTKIITVVFRNPILHVIENRVKSNFGIQLDIWNTNTSQSNRTTIIDKWLDIAKSKFNN
ncbi:hypothetical protein ALC60_12822, partial [Trachymyrmex zeteki]